MTGSNRAAIVDMLVSVSSHHGEAMRTPLTVKLSLAAADSLIWNYALDVLGLDMDDLTERRSELLRKKRADLQRQRQAKIEKIALLQREIQKDTEMIAALYQEETDAHRHTAATT